jgi:hypothetical protein
MDCLLSPAESHRWNSPPLGGKERNAWDLHMSLVSHDRGRIVAMLEAHPTTPRSGPARFETGDGTINAQMSLISAREAASKLDKSPGTFYRIGRMGGPLRCILTHLPRFIVVSRQAGREAIYLQRRVSRRAK